MNSVQRSVMWIGRIKLGPTYHLAVDVDAEHQKKLANALALLIASDRTVRRLMALTYRPIEQFGKRLTTATRRRKKSETELRAARKLLRRRRAHLRQLGGVVPSNLATEPPHRGRYLGKSKKLPKTRSELEIRADLAAQLGGILDKWAPLMAYNPEDWND